MTAYIIRRLLYAIPILIGVNVITFTLFFIVNSPDDMARVHLGVKRVTPEAVKKWKEERGYDRPLLYNDAAAGAKRFTDTIFYEKSVKLFAFEFGRSDQGRDIGYDISTRMWASFAIALSASSSLLLKEPSSPDCFSSAVRASASSRSRRAFFKLWLRTERKITPINTIRESALAIIHVCFGMTAA